MKKILAITLFTGFISNAYAGSSIPVINCASESKRTTLQTSLNQEGETVLTIDGKSISYTEMEVKYLTSLQDKVLVLDAEAHKTGSTSYLRLNAIPSTMNKSSSNLGERATFKARIQAFSTDPRSLGSIGNDIILNCGYVDEI